MHPPRTRPASRAWISCAAALAVVSIAAADTVTLVSINEETSGFFGASVAGIPDIDGDGHDDVIVGASDENGGGVSDAGRVYIWSGATGELIRAHSSPNDTIDGQYGFAVAGFPDLDGDGRGDYAVGAPGELSGRGRVYVYSGATGAQIRLHGSPNDEIGGHFGRAIAGTPDLTGGGRGDYVVGAPDENGGAGHVYVYSGQTGALVRFHNSPNAEASGLFGFAVGAVPDANGDGKAEYIVGAPQEDPGAAPSNSGRAYVYSGGNGALLFTLASSNAESQGQFGYAVAGTPDLGGNGSGDLIVGAPFESTMHDGQTYNDAGRAYVFSGTTGGLAKVLECPLDDLDGANIFGRAVAGIPDRTGDGLGELVVGAPGWPGYHVYLFRGTGDFGLLADVTSPDPLGSNQLFGGAVAAVGDANGDGRGDFVIGARGADDFPSSPSEAGRAYVMRSPLANDTCTLLTLGTLVDGANPFTNIGASGNGGGALVCTQVLDNDIWFKYTATCSGSVTFSTCDAATFDTVIAVYAGCGFVAVPPLEVCSVIGAPLACNDDEGGCAVNTSVVTVPALAGQCFFVQVGGFLGDEGTGVLTVTCNGCPADLDGNGIVNGADLGILLGQWGGAGSADLDGNGVVNGADLGALLASWGAC
ncbi:MAG: FG-GAP-like repeat-containing protein [Phycisphaerales bacterium]